MIRIGKLTDYGILIMTYLARDPARLHAAQEIAQAVGITLPTANKLLKMLARGGLLDSQRGTKGGYSLAREPEAITMVDIIGALEGPVGLTDCGTAQQPGNCQRERSCSVKANWQRISQAVNDALAGVTLAEMTVPSQPIRIFARPSAQPVT
ncbi:MAG: SUF system Fe-S cluster assembly regulator [Betaproteobacteria bacterium]|nr:SUF system Fe-S cluster assembly regulator [Betaproteobacteria bacterium]MDE2343464.1 SUF system Fe-S cluster assembly regulator [Betaproteobacteria bacterium]MDE2621715.1 SUF system Fe-S cluster assembly regulator [Betaproteobacteria bacterium]